MAKAVVLQGQTEERDTQEEGRRRIQEKKFDSCDGDAVDIVQSFVKERRNLVETRHGDEKT